jgi:hypothetical protein
LKPASLLIATHCINEMLLFGVLTALQTCPLVVLATQIGTAIAIINIM